LHERVGGPLYSPVQPFTSAAPARSRDSPRSIALVVDADGVVRFAEGGALAELGLDRRRIVGASVADAFAHVPRVADAVTRAIRGETVRLRVGQAKELDVVVEPREADGGALVTGVVSSPTAAHELTLEHIFGEIPGAVWATDRDLRFTYAFGRLAGSGATGATDWIGRTLSQVLGTDDPTSAGLAHHLAALAGRAVGYSREVGGRTFDVHLEPLRDPSDAVVGTIGVAVDVTERTRAEARLARSEAKLALAQAVAHIGSWEWDVRSDTVEWSDELYRIYGVEPGTFEGSFAGFARRVHPDDVAATRQAVFDALRNGRPFTYDHRIVREDGSVRMLHTRGDVVKDDAGHVVRLAGCCWDVTDRFEATRALECSVSLLRSTLDATADAILVVDRQGKIRAFNERFLAIWNVPRHVVELGDDASALRCALSQVENPDEFLHRVHELYADPEAERSDVVRMRDGRVFERYSRPQRLGQEIVGRVWSFRDVTDHARLLERALYLADAGRLLGSLDVEAALGGVARLSVPFLGDACAVDLVAGAGAPRRVAAACRDPERPIRVDLPRGVLAGRPVLVDRDGTCIMSVPLVGHGEMLGAMTFAAAAPRRYANGDIELASELARRAALSVENARLYRGAEEALHARDEFLSIAAHEIRGPITSIHLAVQAMRRSKLAPSAASKAFGIVEREDRRLGRFVDEMIDVGRIRGGALHFELAEVDLGEVARAAASELGPEIAQSGSRLSITTSGPVVGLWDRKRLLAAVEGLLSNAIKFGLGAPIEIRVADEGGRATLAVEDHGIGIAREMHARIFDPFERAVSARHYGGLGLGLYIVRTIVEGLGGKVHVESELGRGATFTIDLPRGKP
jgi:PAS domain S-box-containing protein